MLKLKGSWSNGPKSSTLPRIKSGFQPLGVSLRTFKLAWSSFPALDTKHMLANAYFPCVCYDLSLDPSPSKCYFTHLRIWRRPKSLAPGPKSLASDFQASTNAFDLGMNQDFANEGYLKRIAKHQRLGNRSHLKNKCCMMFCMCI